MKERDRLILAAFDGGQDGLDRLGESERRELDLLKGLKHDLAALKDVPECQLTPDRVKNAILASHTVPGKSPSRWFWIPTVAAAAVTVFAVTKLAGGPSTDPTARTGALPVSNLGTAAEQGPDHSSAPTGEAVAMTEPRTEPFDLRSEGYVPVPGTDRGAVTAPRRYRTRQSAGRSSGTEQSATLAAMSKPSIETSEGKLRTPEDLKHETVAAMDKAEAEPVVVVSPELNPDTGVSDANEVSRPNDVLFGG